MLHLHAGKIIGFVLLALLLGACQSQSEAPSPVLLRVDGREVTLEQFRLSFSKSLPPGQKLSEEERKELERSFLVQIIDRELALAQADRLAIKIGADEHEKAIEEARKEYPSGTFENMLREQGTNLQDWSTELKKDLLIEKMVRQTVYSKLEVTATEISDYYSNNTKEFDRPAQVRARQIVVASEDEGQKVLGLLRQGELFPEVAKKYSLSPDAEQGGDLGFFAKGEMPPEFETAVFGLAVGRLSDLVKSEYGYHVFLVEEKRKAARLALEEVSDDIREILLAEKKEKAYQEWLRNLRSQATIEMDWSLLK
jgi:peptidyl-prolyl cis-trans isomerase C